MPRILIGECKQEVSLFNPVPSSYADFDVSFGDEVLAFHRGLKSEIGGALDVFAEQSNIELVPPTVLARLPRVGRCPRRTFSAFGAEFLAAACAPPAASGWHLSLTARGDVRRGAGKMTQKAGCLLGCVKLSGNECPLSSRSICMGC